MLDASRMAILKGAEFSLALIMFVIFGTIYLVGVPIVYVLDLTTVKPRHSSQSALGRDRVI